MIVHGGSEKMLNLKNQILSQVFNYSGKQYADHLYPLYYKVITNNVY